MDVSRYLLLALAAVFLLASCRFGPATSKLPETGDITEAGSGAKGNAAKTDESGSLLGQGTSSASGILTDTGGQPVAGVRVKAYSKSGVQPAGGSAEAVTGADGSFSFKDLPEGVLSFEAIKSDDLKAFKSQIQVKKNQAIDVGNLVLEPTGAVSGRVTAPGHPEVTDFLGVDVFIPGSAYTAKTNQAGAYMLDHVAVGTYELAAARSGLGTAFARDVVVRPKDTAHAPDLALSAAPASIASVDPTQAGPGALVTLKGADFGASTGGDFELYLGSGRIPDATRSDDATLVFTVPAGAKSGALEVKVEGIPGGKALFTVLSDIAIAEGDTYLAVGESLRLTAFVTTAEGATSSSSALSTPGLRILADDKYFGLSEGQLLATAEGQTLVGMRSGSLVSVVTVTITARHATVSTLAGAAKGWADGSGAAAAFDFPLAVAAGPGSILYVADQNNHRVRAIGPGAAVTTLAGSGQSGSADGPGASASFQTFSGLATGPDGTLFMTDEGQRKLRAVSAAGVARTLADKLAARDLLVESSGQFLVAVGTADGYTVQRRDASGSFLLDILLGSTLDLATGGAAGSSPEKLLLAPGGMARGPDGSLFLAEAGRHRVVRVSSDGAMTVLAGSTPGFADGPGIDARFRAPQDVAVDPAGNVFVVDSGNHRIRKITPAGVVSTIAGGPEAGFADGAGRSARFNAPQGLTTDVAGDLIVADTGNHRIRRIKL